MTTTERTRGERAAKDAHDVGYACKYTPLELLDSFGAHPVMLDGEEPEFETAESLTHANVCTHAKALIEQALDHERVFLTDCCDSVRRAFDVLDGLERPREAFIMDLPHETDGCSVERLAEELLDLVDLCEARTGAPFDHRTFLAACHARRNEQRMPSSQSEPFVAVLGARTSPELLDAIERIVPLPVLNLTCSGNRWLEEPPRNAAELATGELMRWYAGALLHMVPCMRMSDTAMRRQLTDHPKLAAIVYNTVKFCDFYGFDRQSVQSAVDVPMLKIESDFTPMPEGQLATRLEALCETLGLRPHLPAKPLQEDPMASHLTPAAGSETGAGAVAPLNPNGRYCAGIDSGSTTTNMVVLGPCGETVATAIVRTGAKAQNGAAAALAEVCAQLDATPQDFKAVTATGYGRFNIPFATDTVTEITCHARGVHRLAPQVRTIVDIGGQDSKVICLDEDGSVSNFVMNDKCAAGTGRFLEAMARTLEVDLSRLSVAGLTWDKDLTISSMCTVFAESEVISLIADNHSESDIVHGLNKSIASRTASMVARAKGTTPFMMTGGVARNRGVVEELERKLSAPLAVVDNPDLCGALGAALFARDMACGHSH